MNNQQKADLIKLAKAASRLGQEIEMRFMCDDDEEAAAKLDYSIETGKALIASYVYLEIVKLEAELAAAYSELRKQRPVIRAVFDRSVWDRAEARRNDPQTAMQETTPAVLADDYDTLCERLREALKDALLAQEAQRVEQEPVGEVVERRTATSVSYEGVLYATAILGDKVPPGAKLYAEPQPAPAQDVAGWKLVPVEPTEAMYDAPGEGENDATYRRIYQAMLAAAPQPPQED